jgi:protein TonB
MLHTAVAYAFLTATNIVPPPRLPPLSWRYVPPEDRVPPEPPPEPVVVEAPKVPVVSPPVLHIELTPPPSTTALILPPAPPVSSPAPVDPPVTITPARAVGGTHTIPEYPILSRRLAEEGTVRLAITINADGMVSEARVIRTSGFKRLDEAAVEWVMRMWRYRPAMRGATPIASQAEVVLQFRLNK